MTPFIKDPNATLDYPFDWTTRFPADPLQTSEFISDSGVVVESDSFDDDGSIVWLSGGTKDKRYAVTNRVTTTGGRSDDWTIYVLVKEQ